MSSFKERKNRWLEFYDLTSQRKRIYIAQCEEFGFTERPLLWWENLDKRVEWSCGFYEINMRKAEAVVGDDYIPCLQVTTGTEIFAEAFGCRVHKPIDNNPFALPLVADASEAAKLKIPKLEDTNLPLLFDMADRLKAFAGKDAILNLPDLQSPMDICALIWEKCDFYPALINSPEAVKELSHKVKELMFSFLDAWFARYGVEFISHFPDYYMPRGITLSEDEIGAVSAQVFEELFLDELNEFSDRYGGIGIHCCANAEHQWESLKKVKNLRLINLCQNESVIARSINSFATVCAQFPLRAESAEIEEKNYGGAHLVEFVQAKTAAEASEKIEKLRSL